MRLFGTDPEDHPEDLAVCYTFGYSGRSPHQLAALAEEYTAIVVDVRLKPLSRQVGWSRSALTRRFPGRYVWVPALGNLNYKGGPIRLQDVDVGLRQIVGMIEAGVTPILLCVESDPEQCHRSLVATLVSQRTDCEIVHLPLLRGTRQGLKMPRTEAKGAQRTRKRPRQSPTRRRG